MTRYEAKEAIKEAYGNSEYTDEIIKALEQYSCEDMGEVSDGYHTFNQLYHQRAVLFATIVNQNKDKAWKSLRHEDGELCFGGGWFIVGVDTPEGSYTYHYENKYFDMFDCEILDYGKHWDGHTEEDVTRLLSLQQKPCEDCISRAEAQTEIEMNASRYTIAKERGGMGQVEWSDQLIKVSDAVDTIRHLPSVTSQEQKTGYWIDTGSGQMCSKCGEIQYGYDSFRRYCASCGCRIVELQERSEKE